MPQAQIAENIVSKKFHLSQSFVLKACIFATGLAGIVAEYVMATLASYLLGNAVVQWTVTISLMLFAMGLGSRLSKSIQQTLLDYFIFVELALSVLCAVSALLTYTLAAYIQSIDFVIYLISICIGLLIGFEVPLVTRLNSYFEELRINISSIMEKDYYGALLGGMFFAFVALPTLGLTYTPIVLGAINFLVASVLFLQHRHVLKYPRRLTVAFAILPLFFILLANFAEPIVLFGEQKNYRDEVVYSEQTPYQKIVITTWKGHHWLYLNGSEQFSSYDEEKYHEPLVHPAMALIPAKKNILILGGGDGLAVREVLKYPEVESVLVVDIDPAVTDLAQSNGIFLRLNQGSLSNPKVKVINRDAYTFLKQSDRIFDVVFIDLPDPKSVDLARLYSKQFYQLTAKHLSVGGAIVTQATSPFFAKNAFLSIYKTMQAAGLTAIPYHNHIPTMGEWGWVLGVKADVEKSALKKHLENVTFDQIETRFLNTDAMRNMLNFGKGLFENLHEIEVNDEFNLALFHYYQKGEWDFY
ncbi:MAG: polyamine aminopropyltransferase [bacterium]